MKKLSNLLTEIEITDATLDARIQEYAKLSDEIDRQKAELKKNEAKFKAIDVDLRILLESITDAKDRVLRAKDILVTIKQAGYARDSFSYKDGFELLTTKVNAKIKKLGDECLEATKTTGYVASKLGVQRVGESFSLSSMAQKVISFFKKSVTKITRLVNDVDDDLDHIESLLS
jgi:uncharacterized small protein (DUF1192 family)